jgi:hypothetical protein
MRKQEMSARFSITGERRCLDTGYYRHGETEQKNCRAREDFE